ncbi:hypothetical protein DUNSADRAFT_3186 [Dunaliella salina]|nr:hypothetical protein DUNSADRAFT_3186 [Dunaliella salina]|eukprot:KAF5838271.1 hypothetical protein DUNSADRAFT_3186 [Dunaliella salina]
MLHSMGAAAVSAVAAVTPFRDSWGAGSLDASKLKEKLAAREKRSTHAGILNEGPASKVVVGIPSQDHPTLAGRQGADFKASLRHSRQHRRLSRMRSRSRASASSARLAMARSQSQRHTTSGGSLFGDTDSPKLNHSKSLSHKGQQAHQLEEQQKQLQRALTTGSNSEGSADLGEGTDAGAVCWERTHQKTSSRLGNSNSAWEKASDKSDDEALQVASRMQSAHEPQLLGLDSDPLPAKAWSTEAEALENALDSALPGRVYGRSSGNWWMDSALPGKVWTQGSSFSFAKGGSVRIRQRTPAFLWPRGNLWAQLKRLVDGQCAASLRNFGQLVDRQRAAR